MRLYDVLRNRSSASFVLLFPVVLLLVVGLVFMNGHPFERRRVALVGGDGGLTAVETALEAYDEIVIERVDDEATAMGKLRARMVSVVLVTVPRSDELVAVVGPRDGLFARGLMAALPARSRLEVLEVPRWGYVHYLFPGILTFSVMVAGLFALGYNMVLYRQSGFLKKLATTPLPKRTFVSAQIAARGSLILLQAAILVAVARLGFGLPLSAASLAWLLLASALGTLTFMGVGFVLACLIRTEDLMADIIGAVNLPLVLLSEIFFPLDALPRPLAAFGAALPSTEMVRLCREVLLYGVTDPSALAQRLGVLALWAAVTFAVSLLVFRWH